MTKNMKIFLRFLALRARNDKSLLLITVARHAETYKFKGTIKPRPRCSTLTAVIPSAARNLIN